MTNKENKNEGIESVVENAPDDIVVDIYACVTEYDGARTHEFSIVVNDRMIESYRGDRLPWDKRKTLREIRMGDMCGEAFACIMDNEDTNMEYRLHVNKIYRHPEHEEYLDVTRSDEVFGAFKQALEHRRVECLANRRIFERYRKV